jgi:hypothetical protein
MTNKKLSKEEQENSTRELLDFMIGNKIDTVKKISELVSNIREYQLQTYQYCNQYVPLHMFDINMQMLASVDKLVLFLIDLFLNNIESGSYQTANRHDDKMGEKIKNVL